MAGDATSDEAEYKNCIFNHVFSLLARFQKDIIRTKELCVNIYLIIAYENY